MEDGNERGKIDVKGEIKRKHLKTEIKRWRNKERN